MKMKLVFDTTDAQTIAASDKVGAFVTAADGTLITATGTSLDVEISNASIAVTATDLDIRDLAFATDKVDVTGSEVSLDSATLAALENITVSATDLDIRDLDSATDSVQSDLHDGTGNAITSTAGALDVNIASGSITVTEEDVYAEDSAHASGDQGGFVLAVRQDTLASSTSADGDYAAFKQNSLGELYVKDSDVLAQLTSGVVVTATDLDVRDLAFATDKVDVSGSEVSLDSATLAALENITVSATDLDIRDLAFATDSVDVSGSSVTVSATDLDIRDLDFATDSVDVSGSSVSITGTITTSDAALANTAVLASAVTSTTTSATLGLALASRKYLTVYNNGNKVVYVGQSGVTTSNGFPVFPGSLVEMRLGAAVALHSVAEAGSQNVRALELS